MDWCLLLTSLLRRSLAALAALQGWIGALASWPSRDVDDLAVDKTGFIRSEEANNVGNIPRLTNAADGYNFRGLGNDLVGIEALAASCGASHFGVDEARGNGIDSNAVRAKLNCKRAGEAL